MKKKTKWKIPTPVTPQKPKGEKEVPSLGTIPQDLLMEAFNQRAQELTTSIPTQHDEEVNAPHFTPTPPGGFPKVHGTTTLWQADNMHLIQFATMCNLISSGEWLLLIHIFRDNAWNCE